MFQLDLQQCLEPCVKEYLVRSEKEMGPIFGYGYDLAVFDSYSDGRRGCGGYARVGWGYNVREGSKYDYKDQESVARFCGAPKGIHFQVLEYEVYQLEFQ